jgi:hypothetical protein
MKKLSLNVDALAVQSFSTSDGEGERGTVQGQSDSVYLSCVATACGTSCQYDTKCGSHAITCGDATRCVDSEFSCYTEDPHRCPGGSI